MSDVVRFPPRRTACIWLLAEAEGEWTVIAGSHGWSHGDLADAHADARWLSRNLRLPVRAITSRELTHGAATNV